MASWASKGCSPSHIPPEESELKVRGKGFSYCEESRDHIVDLWTRHVPFSSIRVEKTSKDRSLKSVSFAGSSDLTFPMLYIVKRSLDERCHWVLDLWKEVLVEKEST